MVGFQGRKRLLKWTGNGIPRANRLIGPSKERHMNTPSENYGFKLGRGSNKHRGSNLFLIVFGSCTLSYLYVIPVRRTYFCPRLLWLCHVMETYTVGYTVGDLMPFDDWFALILHCSDRIWKFVWLIMFTWCQKYII